MVISRRTRRSAGAASPELRKTAAAAATKNPTTPPPAEPERTKTAEERANDGESLEKCKGDIQNRLIDLVGRIRGDDDVLPGSSQEVGWSAEADELVESIVCYIETFAAAKMAEKKGKDEKEKEVRTELQVVAENFEKHAACPAEEKQAAYRKVTSFYANKKRILIHRQQFKKPRDESMSG